MTPSDAAIVAATIAMGHSLGLQIIAEGVETEEQRRFLELHRCDRIQGYLLARPMPATDLVDLLRDGLARCASTPSRRLPTVDRRERLRPDQEGVRPRPPSLERSRHERVRRDRRVVGRRAHRGGGRPRGPRLVRHRQRPRRPDPQGRRAGRGPGVGVRQARPRRAHAARRRATTTCSRRSRRWRARRAGCGRCSSTRPPTPSCAATSRPVAATRSADGRSLAEAIEQERSQLHPLKAIADVVVDTTDLNVHQLKARITDLFGDDGESGGMRVNVVSFGYKHGLPLDVDVVLDCRFLPNPHWVDELRPLTGQDDSVRDYVLGQPDAAPFLERIDGLLELLLPAYAREGRTYLSIAIGCTGGRHRSVVDRRGDRRPAARRHGYEPAVTHRDLVPVSAELHAVVAVGGGHGLAPSRCGPASRGPGR